jgi:hypothetical protein
MVIVKGHEVMNCAAEMSLEMFERVSAILSEEIALPNSTKGAFKYETQIEKYCDVLEAAGLPLGVVEEMELEEFQKAVKEWCSFVPEPYEMIKEFELNGRTYKAFEGEEYKLPVKDGRLIEKYAKANNKKYLAEMLAVIFKDTELTNAEHYANAHIKNKANIFRKQLKGSVAVPYAMLIAKKILVSGAKELENANEKEAEQMKEVLNSKDENA